MPMSQTLLKPVVRDLVVDGVMDISTIVADARMIMDHRKVVKAYTGGSREFTASNLERFSLTDNASLSTGDIDFTCAIWVYADSITGTDDIIGKGQYTGSKREWRVHIASSKFGFFVSGNGTVAIEVRADAFGVVPTAGWHFIVAWHDATADTINIQVNDGTIDSLATSGTAPSDRTGDFFIGLEDPVYAQYFDGRISKAGFWKRTLTAAEKTSLYAKGNGKTHAELTAAEKVSLISYWDHNEASGNAIDSEGSNDLTDNATVTANNGPRTSSVEDSSANANHATLSGFSDAQEIEAWSSDVSSDIETGLSLKYDGTNDEVDVGSVAGGNVTSVDFYVKSLVDNQVLFTLQNSTATAVTVVAGTLTFGGSLVASNIKVDTVSKTDAEAGALINDNAWHRVQFDLASITASNMKMGTDSSAFGNIHLDAFKFNAGVLADWSFNDGPQGQGGTIVDGDRVVIVETADGNRWTFSQTTPASCPTWRVIGTRGQLEFDGVDDYLQYPAADISTSAVGECIIVFHADTSGTLFSMTDAAVVNQRWQVIRDTSSLISLEYHNGVTQDNIDGSTTVSAGQERMGGWGSSGTATSLTVDNNDETEAVRSGANNGNWIGDVTGPDNFTIGAQEIAVGVGEELSGNIEMILLMDRELTAAERTLLASVYP
ncbi:MAG: hypothetical protein CL462_10335 [Acidimicrobiaceae bacterium]|nr:hypothetical protein [Acidimicrobiaceae bacterium]